MSGCLKMILGLHCCGRIWLPSGHWQRTLLSDKTDLVSEVITCSFNLLSITWRKTPNASTSWLKASQSVGCAAPHGPAVFAGQAQRTIFGRDGALKKHQRTLPGLLSE